MAQSSYTIKLKNPYGADPLEDVVVTYAFNTVEDIEMTLESNVDEKTNDKKRAIQSSSDIERAVKRQFTDALARAAPTLVSFFLHRFTSNILAFYTPQTPRLTDSRF